MAEYIEREAVNKMLENAQIISDGEYCGYCTEDVTIGAIPAADVVEVVRCPKCKHTSKENHFDIFEWCYCDKWKTEVRKDDFCSYGERRSE